MNNNSNFYPLLMLINDRGDTIETLKVKWRQYKGNIKSQAVIEISNNDGVSSHKRII
jgi:hypothetical protein